MPKIPFFSGVYLETKEPFELWKKKSTEFASIMMAPRDKKTYLVFRDLDSRFFFTQLFTVDTNAATLSDGQ